MMFQEEEATYYVSGNGQVRQGFSSYETAHFFALRLSEACGETLLINKSWFDEEAARWKLVYVGSVHPHQLKLNPAYRRQQQQQQRREAPRPPPPPQTPLRAAYAFLGVSENVGETELRTVFRALSKQYHPDMPGGSTAKFQTLSNHFDTVKKAKGYK